MAIANERKSSATFFFYLVFRYPFMVRGKGECVLHWWTGCYDERVDCGHVSCVRSYEMIEYALNRGMGVVKLQPNAAFCSVTLCVRKTSALDMEDGWGWLKRRAITLHLIPFKRTDLMCKTNGHLLKVKCSNLNKRANVVLLKVKCSTQKSNAAILIKELT